MTVTHHACSFAMLRSAGVWLITKSSCYWSFTLCWFFCCCCSRWTNSGLIILFRSSSRLSVSQRLWWLVGAWSCDSWISIWFTSVTIRLSNRICKFTCEGFFGENELGDTMFVLLLDLFFTVVHLSAHLSFVTSISQGLKTLAVTDELWYWKMEQGVWGSVLKDPKRLWGKGPKAFAYIALIASETAGFWMKTIALQHQYFLNSSVLAQIKIAGNNGINGKRERNNDCRNASLSQTNWLLLSQTCLQ